LSTSTETDHIVEKVAGWLETAFPGHKCAKCGNAKFFILDPPSQPLASGPLTYAAWPVTKLACSRCGFVEEHLTGVLKNTLERSNFQPLAVDQVNE
jgi:hypothetical protein